MVKKTKKKAVDSEVQESSVEVKEETVKEAKKPKASKTVRIVCCEYSQVNPNTGIRYDFTGVEVHPTTLDDGSWESKQIEAGVLKVL